MVDIHQEDRNQRSAPQRTHSAHLRWCSHCAPRKLSSQTREVIRCTTLLGREHSPSTRSLELLGLGNGTKHRPN